MNLTWHHGYFNNNYISKQPLLLVPLLPLTLSLLHDLSAYSVMANNSTIFYWNKYNNIYIIIIPIV